MTYYYLSAPQLLLLVTLFSLLLPWTIAQNEQPQSPSPPTNAACVNATSVTLGETVVSTTTGISSPTGDLDVSLLQCGGQTFDRGTPGVWFAVEGTGALVQATTCSETVTASSSPLHRITVFNGDDCNTLLCLDSGLEQNLDCAFPGGSTVKWQSVPGEPNYILVHDPSATASGGNFEFLLKDVTPPPVNDQCDTAVELVEGVTTGGTTLGATASSADDALVECGNLLDIDTTAPTSRIPQSVGVWYRIPASEVLEDDKDMLSVFVCSDKEGLELAVFSGSSCGETACVETSISEKFDLNCGTEFVPVLVSFNATIGEAYYVYIYGVDNVVFGVELARTNGEVLANGSGTNDPPSAAAVAVGTMRTLLRLFHLVYSTVNLLL